MLVPLIRTLQKHLPKAKLTWVISKPAYDLVASIDNVEFIVIDKPNNLCDYWQFRRQMAGRHFDVLLAVQSSFRANLLYAFIKAKRKIGYDKLRAKDCHKWFINEKISTGKDHTLDGFLRFAKALGIDEMEISWDLQLSETDYHFAVENLPKTPSGPLLLVNPAASKPERSWTVDGYVEIISYAQKKFNAEVVLIGGPNKHDRELGDAISKRVTVKNLIGRTRLTELLAVISLGDLLICPDTGPSHMAAAVDTKVIALHAVTSANVSGPYTFRHLSVDRYDEAVSVILNTTLQKNDWGTHAHGPETMQLIKPPMVIEKLNIALS
ncbi:MAG: glycosyltransferase family 9 protein [Legionellaceae bacterium]|nr:glycosyltransferase family 9 protein [Legionellaceae bacterium]